MILHFCPGEFEYGARWSAREGSFGRGTAENDVGSAICRYLSST